VAGSRLLDAFEDQKQRPPDCAHKRKAILQAEPIDANASAINACNRVQP
jgi:hypothetical protein